MNLNTIISKDSVVVFSKDECHYCDKLVADLTAMCIPFQKYNLNDLTDIKDELVIMTGCKTVPQLFIGGAFIGGYQDFAKLCSVGKLEKLLQPIGITPIIDF